MKQLAVLILLALELAICSCGSSTIASTTTNTATSGKWEAQLIENSGNFDQSTLLNFVTAFSVTNSGPLDITGFGFINAGKCFSNGVNGSTETGNATLVTGSANQVTGTLSFKVVSVTPPGNTLSMTGNLTGTSNGTPTTTGTLSNGVVVGAWTLTGGAGDPTCTGGGSFLMCQGTNTCTAP